MGGTRRELAAQGWAFGALLALALAMSSLSPAPAEGQQAWAPTVATSPGGSLNETMPGHLNRAPTSIDPRFFPSPHETARAPRGPAAWSPIVTGALPGTRGVADAVPKALRIETQAQAQAPEALTPLRPAQPRAAAPAAGAARVPQATDGTHEADVAGEAGPPAGEAPAAKGPSPLDALPPNATAAEQYCFNTVDTAADARFAWQAKKIREMEAELEKKSQQLQAKTEEYKRWLERRDAFARKAHEKLVGFYSRMRPDAAALQLASLDEETAAAVVTKLETKVASQIMGEMNPERAAKIATIISGAAKVPAERRPAPPADRAPPDGSEADGVSEGPRS